jgi:hypothetical protein
MTATANIKTGFEFKSLHTNLHRDEFHYSCQVVSM